MQVTVSAANIWMTIFIVIMQMGVSVTFKSVISGLHFTTLVKILPKLKYFEGRNDIQIGYKSYSVLLFS